MMKKKIAVLTMAGSIIFGSVAGAVSNYYVDQVLAFKEQHKESLAERYEKETEKYNQIKHDQLMWEVETSRKRIEKETNMYLITKVGQNAGKEIDQTKKQIQAETDQAIKELKKYVDSLLEGETE